MTEPDEHASDAPDDASGPPDVAVEPRTGPGEGEDTGPDPSRDDDVA
mgnify:CR=1 FL=1